MSNTLSGYQQMGTIDPLRWPAAGPGPPADARAPSRG